METKTMTVAELHALSTYAQQTFGRPINQNQCLGCGRMAIPGISAIAVNIHGLCPRCRAIRTPSAESVVLFTPLRRQP